ncbi:TetR/AcrR family transcriptional regulator [Spiractinospora alimapuensis]|uniref:TetR/AcrR family transcriptional regulator n=1 Tax=Spiractinospora alimapuensis TaxID=2820884 RepID=UPI001F3913AB|nr:TetR/AcrR family transcriptional regulator [Spiractinospora alimapuensis]QVQ54116.1 TetR/AcrR family transcriptional regulator [Spiractinospora alimapuensis]
MPKISAATIAEHRAQTRERILEAVSALTRHRGIDSVSLTEVAEAAGVTRTALYNYFPDKPALLLAFAEEVTALFVRRYEDRVTAEDTAAERLDRFLLLQLEGIVEHPHPASGELGATLGPEAYQALAEHVAPMHRLLGDILAAGGESGEFVVTDTVAVSRLIMALIGSQRVPLLRAETTVEDSHRLVATFALRALTAST